MASCQVETEIDSPGLSHRNLVTISASVPDTKVALTPDGGGLHLAWEDGDCLRVLSGSASERFDIKEGYTDHQATFTGAGVEGTSFDVMYPGTFASIEEAEASDFGYQVQDGNGSTAHLRYAALLSGVDDYKNITFSKDWAEAHGGSFKNAGAIRLVLTLPAGVTSVDMASIDLAGRKLSLQLDNIDVSASDQVLTAYLMTPWNDIVLQAGSEVEVTVTDPEKNVYGITIPFDTEKTLLAGQVSNFTISHNIEEYPFAGGDGTQANPWLIANARQLENMMNLYKNADMPADKDSFKYWFKMINDVDASGIAWTPLNLKAANSIGYFQAIDFDGDGHTISGLTASGSYASFAGVLYGSIRNVTFDGATITSTSKCGVVAGFLGTTYSANSVLYVIPASCENVTVKGSTVNGGSTYAGGFAGHVKTSGAISNCHVVNTTVSGTGALGGFAGFADISGYDVPAIFTDCSVEGSTLNQNNSSTELKAVYTGGFIGGTGQAYSFRDCYVSGTTVKANSGLTSDVGGFVGYTSYVGSNFQNCEVRSDVTINGNGNNIGGFVGLANVSDSFKACSVAGNVINASHMTGGFAGYAAGSSSFLDSHVTGNVTGKRFTGGFVGVAENASFTNCYYAEGTVTSGANDNNSRCGTFVGVALTNVNLQGCYVSEATMSAASAARVGGFVGQLGNNSVGNNGVSARQCYVEYTDVIGKGNTGGFSGVQYDNTSYCHVLNGSVKAGGGNSGGFTAYLQNGNLTNCYSTAALTGTSVVGGMIGAAYETNVSFCYSAGQVSGSSGVGAFVGKCNKASSTFSNCIGWGSQPFAGDNTVGATLTTCYAGTEGSVSAQAQTQAWPTSVWNLNNPLPLLVHSPSRIPAIFVGDSITWQWSLLDRTWAQSKILIPIDPLPSYMTISGSNVIVDFHPWFFAANGYIDKGISGQNTSQMLERFQKDVIDFAPSVVVIMGGTNDLAQGVTKDDILANLSSMAEMADAAGIKVVLCSVTPNNDSYSRLSNPKTKGAHIITLNSMIQDYVAAHGFTYCDYWTHLVAEDGLALHPDYRLYDNLHPGPDGYDVMEPIIKAIIDGLL